MKRIDFIKDLFAITENYDSDGNGLCGESYEEVVEMLKKDYSALFEAYNLLKEVDINGKMF